MKSLSFIALSVLAAGPVLAEENRQLDAHEHGVGELNIAFDGSEIAMELHAPGADIVGFEYEAESAEDRAAVDAAIATLSRPLELFSLPEAAACTVVEVNASLESEAEHDDHDHDDHKDEEHADHDDHDHDDHKDEEHAEHDHDDHDDHADEAGHTEFHAEYLIKCANIDEVNDIAFAYFEAFPNALEVEVQLVSEKGASAFEVERDEPSLDLRGSF